MKSEFGKGLTYCLGLFLAHAQDHRIESELKDAKGIRPELSVELWFYGAADHLFDLEIPKNLPYRLKKRIKKFQSRVLFLRMPVGRTVNGPTEEDKNWAIQEAKDLLRLIDKHFGVKTGKAQWE